MNCVLKSRKSYTNNGKTYKNVPKRIEFGHTLESQIQGQFDHGFVMNGFYEDDFNGNRPLDKYLKCFIVTKSIKQ